MSGYVLTDDEVQEIADVLAVHIYALGLSRYSICTCGFVPDVDPASLRTQQDYHRAHITAALAPVVAAMIDAHRLEALVMDDLATDEAVLLGPA